MGHSQAAKQHTHARLVRRAAARIREGGLDALRVAELMKAAGLTHGGFYGHFSSRAALIEEAVARALAQSPARPGEAGGPTWPDWTRSYLSPTHRDNRAGGCALAALAGDVARAPAPVRALFTRHLVALADTISRDAFSGAGVERSQALATMATLIGALILARAVDDEHFSNEILAAARRSLLTPPSPRRRRRDSAPRRAPRRQRARD